MSVRADLLPLNVKEAQLHLEALVESAADAIFTATLTGDITSWNKAAERLFGYTAQEMLGQPLQLLLPAELYEEEAQILQRLCQGEHVSSYESQRRTKDGTRLPISVTSSPLWNKEGLLIGISQIARDITPQKRAEEQLREAARRNEQMLASITDGVYLFDQEFRYQYVNQAGLEIAGFTSAELLGRKISEVYPLLEGKQVEQEFARALQEQVPVQFEIYYSVTQRWFEIRGYPSAAGVTAYVADITIRKELAESLRKNEERLRLVHEVTMVGDWEWNSATNEVFWSPEYRTIYGLDANAAPAFEKGMAVVVEEDREAIQQALAHALESGEEYRSEHRIQHPQKGLRWIQTIGRTVKDEQQGTVRMLGLVMDVTTWKQVEQEAGEAAERFSKAFMASPLLMTVTSLRDGRLVEVNETFTRLSGYTRAEAIGRTTAELGVWSKLEDRRQELETLRQTGRLSNVEYSFRRRDGEEVVGLLSAERIEINGEPCALTVIQNITERKQAERAVRESAERLRLALEAAQMGPWSWEVATNLVTLSERAAEILGVQTTQLPWTELRPLLHEADHARAHQAVQQAFTTNSPFDIEYRVQRTGENLIWVAAKGQASYDEAGQLQSIRGVVQDVTARKQAEEVQRLNEERLHLALESSALGMWSVELPENKMTSTPRNLAILGFAPDGPQPTPEELVTRLHPKDLRRITEAWNRCVEQGELFELEYRIIQPDDQVRWVSAKGKRFVDASGKPSKLIGISADITDQKQAELLLREQEERHRLALEAGQIGTWDWDVVQNHVVWSDLIYKFHGLQPGEFSGKVEDFAAIVHPEDRKRVEDAINAALENKAPYSIETRLVWPNGEVHWIATEGKVYFDATGQPVRMIGATVEITERRRAEQGMLEKAAEIQALLEAVPAAVIITREPEAKLIAGNRTAHKLLRMVPAEALSLITAEGKLPDHFKLLKEGLEIPPGELPVQLAARGIEIEDYELELLFTDGTTKHLFGNASPLRGPDGQVRGAISAFVDITVLKQLEAALKEAERRKDEFLAMLAHELRNPLAPILYAVQLMRRGELPAPQLAKMRDVIERQAQQLTRLVDDLLDVARITQGKIELRKEKLELLTIVGRAVETSRPLLEARQHQFTIALPKEAIQLEGDLTRLAQVLANLLNNAAKYTEEGGHIKLTGERRDNELLLRIQDDGIGIPPQDLPYVFDLFAQADRSLDRRQGGLGIGLTLVKKLVELHGGKVEAISEGPGLGSEFVVHLPILVEPAAEARWSAGLPEKSEAGAGHCCRVLVVDDNQDSADSMGMLLQFEGHEVRIVYDGPEALELARQFRPNIVLLDIGLPRMNGYEVARVLRSEAIFQKTVLIALTGYGQAEDRAKSKEAGFDHHFTKPVNHDRLVSLIKSLVLN